MTSFTELFSSFDPNSKQCSVFLQNLLTINNDIPFKSEEVNAINDAITSTINSQLNQANTRYNGLLLLDIYALECTKESLLKYAILWITKATQVVENIHSSPQQLTIACKVIGNIVGRCKAIPELQKQISMNNVKQLLNVLDNLESATNYGATYYLLANLLYYYPEVCERFQALIMKMVLLQVDASQTNLAEAGAKCFALLSTATERTFNPPPTKLFYTCWTYNQALICNTLHGIMDNLFTNLLETQSIDIWDKLELSSISEENIIEYYYKQNQRFENLCIYLCTMLRGCEEKNSVLPDDILRVICRGLAIRPIILKGQNSFKERMLYLILPKLHISLYKVLHALINGFKHELIASGLTILQLLYHTLKWTENTVEDQITISNSKPFKCIRLCAYQCLSFWSKCNNSLSGIETIAEDCLPYILKDIIPKKDRVQLMVQNAPNLSKKALKRLRDGQYEKSSALNNTVRTIKNPCIDADLCREALIVLQTILSSCGIYLKPTFYKSVQNVVIPLLYEYYLGSSVLNFYKEAQCRLQLLRVLRYLELNPHFSFPPSTQYAVKIFEMALSDADIHIVQEAQCGLPELEKIIHPVAPTLCLPRTEEMLNGIDEVSINETMTQDDFTAPLNKRPKIVDIVTLNSDKKIQFNTKMNVIDNIEEKSIDPINNSSKTEENLLEESKNIVNEEEIIPKYDDFEFEKDSQEDQAFSETEDRISEKVERAEYDIQKHIKEDIETAKYDFEERINEDVKTAEDDVEERIKEDIETAENDVKEHVKEGYSLETFKEEEENLSLDEETEQLLLLFHDEPKDSNET